MALVIQTGEYELILEGHEEGYDASTGGDHYGSGSDYRVSWIEGTGILKKRGRKTKKIFKFSTEHYLGSLESLFKEYYEDGPVYARKDTSREYAPIPEETSRLFNELFLRQIRARLEDQKEEDFPSIYLAHYNKSWLEKNGIISDRDGQWWFCFN